MIVENLLFSVEIDEAIVFRTETLLLACLLLMEVAFYSCLCDVNSILPSTPSTVYLQDIDEYSSAVMGGGYELMLHRLLKRNKLGGYTSI